VLCCDVLVVGGRQDGLAGFLQFTWTFVSLMFDVVFDMFIDLGPVKQKKRNDLLLLLLL